jgi:hypothetical protein
MAPRNQKLSPKQLSDRGAYWQMLLHPMRQVIMK